MTIADRLHTSWELMRSSLQVMRGSPRLLLFPLVSAACSVALALFFFAPFLYLLFTETWYTPPEWIAVGKQIQGLTKEAQFDQFAHSIAGGFYAYGALIYLVSLVTGTFFNVAFYHAVMRALAGEAVSLRGGLRFALSRSSAILRWSLLAGTVGLVIRTVEEKLGWVGRLMLGFLGAAWSVAAVFAIPVIVRREESNPFAVLRDSAATLKRTWGEAVAGFVGIQIFGAVAVVGLTVLAIAALIGAALLHKVWMMVAIGGLWFVGLLAVGVFFSLATHIYRCALYIYASEGVVPGPYTAELMDAGWKVRKA
jgi:hypothetical protein